MKRFTRWSWILLVAGILLILTATWLNRPSIWRPLVVDGSVTDSNTTDVRLRAGVEYEVSVEIERRMAGAVAKELVTREPQSAIVGQWAIACRGEPIATGDLTNYIRIKEVATWRGELYRLVARVPFGVDEAKYWGFGLTGRYLSERIVGAFQSPDAVTEPCQFSWAIERSADNVRIALRRNDQDWRKHSRQVTFLPVGGALALLFGLFGLLLRGLIVLRSSRADSPSSPR